MCGRANGPRVTDVAGWAKVAGNETCRRAIVGIWYRCAGVYISYPFCAQKCTYCNFASGVFSNELAGPLHRGRDRGIALRRNGPGLRKQSISAAARPARPIRACFSTRFRAGRGCEATMEAAPGTIDRGKGDRLARGRHQSRKPGCAVVHFAGAGAHGPQAYRGNRRARRRGAARGGIEFDQCRSDRGIAGTDAQELVGIARLDREGERAARVGVHAGGG